MQFAFKLRRFIFNFFLLITYFKIFYWIKKSKIFDFLLGVKNTFLKQSKHNLNMTLTLLIHNKNKRIKNETT